MPKAATRTATSRNMAVTRCRSAPGTPTLPPPLQLLVEAVVFLDGEAEPPEQPHRRIDLLDVDPQRLAACSGFVHQVAQQRLAGALRPVFGQQRDVDDAVPGAAALEIKPPCILTVAHDHQPDGLRMMFALMQVLQVE